jgi:Uma2 family endonuclease
MAHAEPVATSSYAEYLELERTSRRKHEYLRGEVFAMAGGTLEHGRLASRVSWLIRNALGERPCETFSSDAKVRIDETDLTTYPDVTVICGRIQRSSIDPEAATNPVVLVEVLSESSEAYDRGEKFAHYRRLPSLREYVLVAQDEPRLEVFRRTPAGTWELFEARPGGRVTLESVGVELAVDDVFRSALETS